jgi:hypothetical protein
MISRALHLNIFEEPGKNQLFSMLLTASVFYLLIQYSSRGVALIISSNVGAPSAAMLSSL